MLPAFVIGLREGLEAVVIVGVIAVFLRVQRRDDLLRRVWRASLFASAICAVVAFLIWFVEVNLPWRQQEQFETVIGLAAVLTVTYMVVWMRRFPKDLQRETSAAAASALSRDAGRGLVALAFFAVLREGFEIAVFVIATIGLTGGSALLATGGACLGVLVALLIGVGIVRGSRHLDVARFFRVTALVLVLSAAGIAMSTVHSANAAGWITFGQTPQFDIAWLAPPGSALSSITTGMFGIQPYPVIIEVLAWGAYFFPMTAVVLWPRKAPRVPAGSTSSSVPASRHKLTSRRRVALVLGCTVALGALGAGIAVGEGGPGVSAPTQSAPSALFASLADVSCTSNARCVAVGEFLPKDKDAAAGDPDGDGRATHSLAEALDGPRWRLLKSPDKGRGGTALSSVSCPGTAHCVAVGYYRPGRDGLKTLIAPPSYPLAESYDGRSWRIVATPPVAPNSVLVSVSCPRVSTCYAAGNTTRSSHGASAVESMFIDRYDGRSWAQVPIDLPPRSSSELNSIACSSALRCVAVGDLAPRRDPTSTRPLIEVLSNGAWAESTLPPGVDGPGIFYDVTCVSGGRCVAVGSSQAVRSSGAGLVVFSRASTWSADPAALAKDGDVSLTSVACETASSCVTAGTDWVSRTVGTVKVLARVTRSTWRELPVSNQLENIEGMSCVGGGRCLLIGSVPRNTFGNTTTLIASLEGETATKEQSPTP